MVTRDKAVQRILRLFAPAPIAGGTTRHDGTEDIRPQVVVTRRSIIHMELYMPFCRLRNQMQYAVEL